MSPHVEVRNALVAASISFALVYPEWEGMEEYIARYEDRQSPAAFVNLIRSKWDEFLGELEQQSNCTHYVLKEGQYLSDVLDKIIAPPSPTIIEELRL